MAYRPILPLSDETLQAFKVMAAKEGKPTNRLMSEILILGYQKKLESSVAISL